MEKIWLNEAFKGEVPNDFQGKVGWASPSNIALVKYWGKKGIESFCNLFDSCY